MAGRTDRPSEPRAPAPLDLSSFAETHRLNVVVSPPEHPADAKVRRVKDLSLFFAALLGLIAIAGYSLYVLVGHVGSADDSKWAAATLTAIVGGLLGYLTGKAQRG